MITKKIYVDRIKLGISYKYAIITKYLLFGFIPVYIKYEELR